MAQHIPFDFLYFQCNCGSGCTFYNGNFMLRTTFILKK